MRFIPSKSFLMFGCLLLLFAASSAYGVTYTTVKNGNWTDPCTWNPGPMGGPCPGSVPPNNPIPATDTVNVNHVVTFNTTPLVNFGTLRIQMVGGPAWLQIPSNVNVENRLGALMEVLTGRLLQCRFTDCDDGQPYAGTNPQPNQQSGVWVNKGGTVNIIGSIVEVAQRWTNEKDGSTPGTRNIIDSCVFTGQDFTVVDSNEVITRSLISVGWHGSGNFQTQGTTNIDYDRVVIQLAGASGNFSQASSVNHSGDIDYITLQNQVGGFIGSGNIMNDPGMAGSPVNLDAYCKGVGAYIPNGEFVGPQTPICGLSTACGAIVITASYVSVEGRVMTHDGVGIGGANLRISGGALEQPINARSNAFGYYSFPGLEVGYVYIVEIASKRHVFAEPTRALAVNDTVTGFDFIAEEPISVFPTLDSKRKP